MSHLLRDVNTELVKVGAGHSLGAAQGFSAVEAVMLVSLSIFSFDPILTVRPPPSFLSFDIHNKENQDPLFALYKWESLSSFCRGASQNFPRRHPERRFENRRDNLEGRLKARTTGLGNPIGDIHTSRVE